jgi:hypothetical protein
MPGIARCLVCHVAPPWQIAHRPYNLDFSRESFKDRSDIEEIGSTVARCSFLAFPQNLLLPLDRTDLFDISIIYLEMPKMGVKDKIGWAAFPARLGPLFCTKAQ